MKLTYKNIITALKFVTTTSFIVALGFKLYNIYKYGGPKKPEKPVEREDDYDDPVEREDDYDDPVEPSGNYAEPKSYKED